MTVRPRLPGHAARSHNQRLSVLERRNADRTQDNTSRGWIYWHETFSQAYPSVAASGRYYPAFTGELYGAVASLKTAGSSTTTVVVKVNGGAQATINLASSDHFEQASLDDILQADVDYATVETTAVGTGAEGLTVELRFRRPAT